MVLLKEVKKTENGLVGVTEKKEEIPLSEPSFRKMECLLEEGDDKEKEKTIDDFKKYYANDWNKYFQIDGILVLPENTAILNKKKKASEI